MLVRKTEKSSRALLDQSLARTRAPGKGCDLPRDQIGIFVPRSSPLWLDYPCHAVTAPMYSLIGSARLVFIIHHIGDQVRQVGSPLLGGKSGSQAVEDVANAACLGPLTRQFTPGRAWPSSSPTAGRRRQARQAIQGIAGPTVGQTFNQSVRRPWLSSHGSRRQPSGAYGSP